MNSWDRNEYFNAIGELENLACKNGLHNPWDYLYVKDIKV